MKYIEKLAIPYEKRLVPSAPRSAKIIYQKIDLDPMRFQDKNLVI